MKKNIKITEEQFKKYIDRKKYDGAYNEIVNIILENNKHLNKKLPIDKINMELVESYKKLNQIDDRTINRLINGGYLKNNN